MTVPSSLAVIPASLSDAASRDLLDVPLTEFLATSGLSAVLRHAVTTVSTILRMRRVGDLCSDEAESLFQNRFSAGISVALRAHLWEWLVTYADRDDPDDLLDEYEDDELDRGTFTPRALGVSASPVALPGKREGLPAIEAPPVTSPALEQWCAAHKVGARLDDRIQVEALRSAYGLRQDGLPETVREAARVTEDDLFGPAYYRSHAAAQLVSTAKAYLHRAAQAVALAERSSAERAGRAREPGDPSVLQFLQLVRRERDGLLAPAKPRPAGTYLPGRISLRPDPPALAYSEWQINEARTPSFEGDPFFFVQLAAWDSGHLRFECKRCREPASCPHVATVLDHLSALLQDPAEPLAAALAPTLRVPGWSRLLDHLDRRMAKAPATPDPSQRLIWEVIDEYGAMAVMPVLQKQGKRGWSRGQRLPLERLEREPALLSDPVDQAAFEALLDTRDVHGYYYGSRQQSPRQLWRGLAALAGTSRVFAAPARSSPIVVRKVRPALRVESGDKDYRLRSTLGPAEVEPAALLRAAPDGRHLVWLDLANHRCLLALLDTDTAALLSAMAEFPVAMPAEAVAELVSRLPRMQGAMDVHLPEAVRGERVEPGTAIVCRLEPLPESGMRIEMVVRPIADGPAFPPGEGPPEVLQARDGRRFHAMRPLGAERERAVHLAQVLGLDDSTAAGAWRWDVVDDCAALDVLAKLRESPQLAEVEWPAGEVRVDRVVRSALKVQVHKRRDWFGADGGVEIDGKRVPLSELLAAARAGRRYVRVNANRFAAIEDELRDRLLALDDVTFDNQGAIELGLLAAPVLAELVDDPGQLDLVPAFRAVMGNLAAARTEQVTLPEGLQATLRHYQEDGFRWLARLATWGLGACLADDMGLGKTVQALALLVRRASLGPALVVAPTSVVANWAAECAKFAPGLAPRIYRGPERAALREGLGKGSLLITSYAIAVRDAEALGAITFSTLIVDEAQSVKNALTQRFRAIRDVQADFRVALTGTPIENHLGELWAIFRLVTPGLLGSWDQFRQRFAVPIERHHDRGRQTGLARVVRPFLLRRTKAEVAPELPARTEMNQVIELGPIERRLYEAARAEILESLAKSAAAGVGDEARRRIKILAALTRLRLLCCHPRLVDSDSTASSAKLAALVELLTELRDEGHRALVFSQFTSFLDLARPLLAGAGLRTLTLDGSTPAAAREELVRAFQAGEADAFLLSLRAGGTGLNLTAATYVIHLDPWWNPAVEDQATDRAHRIGQDRPVTVIRMVVRGTIEEAVLSLHEEKRQLAASILDGADAAARLDSDDLLDLIRRSGQASEEGDAAEEEGEGEPAVP